MKTTRYLCLTLLSGLLFLAVSARAADPVVVRINGVSYQVTNDTELTITDTNAPVISGPAVKIIDFLTSVGSSNWMVAAYGIYDMGSDTAGAGLGLGYKISDYVVPTMRIDWLNDQVWMPSASLQLQAPFKIMGKLEVIPFAFSGIATPVSGRGDDNGEVMGIFGVGGAIRLWSHFDFIADYEKWSGFKGQQVRFGMLYKF